MIIHEIEGFSQVMFEIGDFWFGLLVGQCVRKTMFLSGFSQHWFLIKVDASKWIKYVLGCINSYVFQKYCNWLWINENKKALISSLT